MPGVLYVTGWCRSGTTLLGNLLGELPGVLHTGEQRYLWANGVLGHGTNGLCGCGETLTACPLWSAVLAGVTGGDPGYPARAAAAQQDWLRTRHTGARLAESAGQRPRPAGASAALAQLERLYQAIAGAGAARLIVDSGKFPAEAAALCGSSEVDVKVLHMVRDPRATAESWRRAKAYIPPMGVLRSTGYWAAFNLASERIGRAFPGRYLRVSYEDFAVAPRQVLTAVLSFAQVEAEAPVRADGRATLGVNHTVTGNPDRLLRGEVRVRPDEAWRAAQPRRHRLAATAVAGPFLHRYGYRLAVPRHAQAAGPPTLAGGPHTEAGGPHSEAAPPASPAPQPGWSR